MTSPAEESADGWLAGTPVVRSLGGSQFWQAAWLARCDDLSWSLTWYHDGLWVLAFFMGDTLESSCLGASWRKVLSAAPPSVVKAFASAIG